MHNFWPTKKPVVYGKTIHFSSRSIYQHGIYVAKIGTRLVFSLYLLKTVYHLGHFGQDENTALRALAALFSTLALWHKVNV